MWSRRIIGIITLNFEQILEGDDSGIGEHHTEELQDNSDHCRRL